jgi:hypothetical protein
VSTQNRLPAVSAPSITSPLPANWGENVSIVGAVCADRVLAHRTFDGAVNGPRFIDFVLPAIVSGGRRRARQPFRAITRWRSAPWWRKRERLLFVPPYSPDFRPIEPSFPCLKAAIARDRGA